MVKQKKILLLGGSSQQIIAIEKAKELGYYTILCDYLEDNPGQHYADKFYLASTTDKYKILEISKKEDIDGILAYASDPAAPTAAFVSEKLGLPGTPYNIVNTLCNKGKFRKFLKDNNFFTPESKEYVNITDAINDLKQGFFRFPVIVKPVDSSGSKGVGLIESSHSVSLKEKIECAMSYSRSKVIIVEEYVEKFGYQIAGDGISLDGKLVFRYFANDHFNMKCVNPYVPISASFPYNMPNEIQNKVHSEIQRFIELIGIKNSTYNFDIRIDKDYNVYLMEIAPRDGGNYIPQVIQYATGVDLVEISIRLSMGEEIEDSFCNTSKGFWSYYAIHSLEDGILDQIIIDDIVMQNNVVEQHIVVRPGDVISAFRGANTTLGILLMKFDSMDEMLNMMDHSEKWIQVKLS